MMGVYCISNRITGSCYVGSSRNIKQRWKTHRADLRRHLHFAPQLQRDWDVYGESAFEFVVLEEVVDVPSLLAREYVYIFDLAPDYNTRGHSQEQPKVPALKRHFMPRDRGPDYMPLTEAYDRYGRRPVDRLRGKTGEPAVLTEIARRKRRGFSPSREAGFPGFSHSSYSLPVGLFCGRIGP